MKKILLLSFIGLLLSCSGVKKTQEALNSGNYMAAINKAVMNIAENKTKKSNQTYIILLEEGYRKNTERELQNIKFLKKDGNAANYEEIYDAYGRLKSIQERIRPLLPLYIQDENRKAQFNFKNYDDDLIAAKSNLSEFLYNKATTLLKDANYKLDYRNAYNDLKYLEEINPNYKDVTSKIDEAYLKGLDYVIVEMTNNTDKIIPKRLEDELLNLNTYGLNSNWTQYHTNRIQNQLYDYQMEVSFQDINISPEQINEKQISKEKQIKDGYTFVEDRNGNVVSDSLGNSIKIDKFKTVKCDFYQFTQFKSAQVTGVVNFIDLKKQQKINQYPLTSQFVFEHIYANYDGDKRALDNDLVSLLQLAKVPFPSNEQMVYDAGEDLKNNLKRILNNQSFN
ncbi:hypothetical protein [Maribacter hydrothermalis]|uniref:Lipoprotein n=1 Tax=Maribacter hydrothermalis TaxID=1836467 RepID=A0A1B7Z7Z1_9FLAO|nr:hypothetical protein [Maribacter hydrothermalis]APQ19141.1 hypothetical protein BTR34_18240 [Maribacter hydrothermalis]OBR38848.1 hypothetical protein A9200_04045 [Maribacter hydrothermalis]